MSNILKRDALASLACLAIAIAAVGSAVAQEQSDQNQREQSDQDQRDDSQQQSSDEQNQQSATQSDSQSERQQARQREQRQQQERQSQQQQRQRQQQSELGGQQSQDRDQSSWDESDSSRGSQWPQPNGRDYGSDSLTYRDQQQGRSSQQGGLGVSLKSDSREGVIVSLVHSGSPAEEMGIRQGDRITGVNGRQVQSIQQFIARIRGMDPGQQIELDIRRARGGEQTVRGELESRDDALADSDNPTRWLDQQRLQADQQQRGWQNDQYGRQEGDNQQTRYEEERGRYSENRPAPQPGNNRLDQIERQVDRLSREINELRVSLQSIRRQSGQSAAGNRERTARYDEYEGASSSRRQSDERQDGRDTYRQSDRNRGESRDSFDDGPAGEIGSDRQRVLSENIRDRD